ncbi:restriction endonuclease subunit S [Bartonella sp. DGB1]|uniref:restriction endonuclease subunit S n=1 Tax=Bartonella sp. DGB1 TaxID=3239807 RepID=UPI00352672C5
MTLIKLKDLFHIKYGTNLELSTLDCVERGIFFVSRTAKNNGVAAYVSPLSDVTPNPANSISVAVSGSVCEAFLQKEPYYSGRDLVYLLPKQDLSDLQMLFYCYTIRVNNYRYNYGRQANKTLGDLLIPSIESIPDWVENIKIPQMPSNLPCINSKVMFDTKNWLDFSLGDIFTLQRGKEIVTNCEIGNTPLISSSELNNGVNIYISNGKFLFAGNQITIANNGSVGSCFFQANSFYATTDITILSSSNLNAYRGLFISSLIEKEKYRFGYGRKWGMNRMKNFKIKLPVTEKGELDWQFMEDYIKSLPYSSNLGK